MSIKIALAGNPNSGKTTLFNALTGSNQFVGNWPGVTVEKKEGQLKGRKGVIITDLPGIYSLSPYTLEEVVARNYLINERPDAILNIVDGTNIERNLYLTTQLLELGIPVVMAVNMMDVVQKNGDMLDAHNLSHAIGCAVVPISALKGTGVKEAADAAINLARSHVTPMPPHKFCPEAEDAVDRIMLMLGHDVPEAQRRFYAVKLFERDVRIGELIARPPDVESIIKAVEQTLDDDAESIITNDRYNYIASIIDDSYTRKNTGLTTSDKIDRVLTNRFAALPIFAAIMFIVYFVSVTTVGAWATDWMGDGVFGEGWHLLGIGAGEYEHAAELYELEAAKADVFLDAADRDGIDTAAVREALALEADGHDGAADAALDEFSHAAAGVTALLGLEQDGLTIDMRVDIADFMAAARTGEPDPAAYGAWVPGIPGLVESGLAAANAAPWLRGLILDGIIGGVGAVLGFVPQMLVLFLLLAFLEACGYMARIAFIMDRIFRKFGLSGKSFIPILIGTGCGVPGIMASRTIENPSDRRMTIITTTFIPCGAKLPIIALIAGALFDGAWWVAPSAYFIGIAAIVASGVMLKKTRMFAGETAPFVMELPPYHMPTVTNLLRSMWERGWSFIKKAGTLILLSAMAIWFLSSFGWTDGSFGMVDDMGQSMLAAVGSGIAWIFAPLGFGRWEAAVATLTGLAAKENVVATFGVLFGFGGVSETGTEIWGALSASFTAVAGFAFLVFNLLCAPCFAAIGAIRREMNSARWTAFAIGYQTLFAYIVALCVYQLGTLCTTGEFGVWTAVALTMAGLFAFMLLRKGKTIIRA